jgi:hypothetical protein
MKIPFKKISRSITGISTPFFGISWNPPDSDREIARKLLVSLEDRRALFDPIEIDKPEYVFYSVQDIRRHLTKILESLENADPFLEQTIRELRAACRKYTSIMRGSGMISHTSIIDSIALGELRGVFGIYLARLAVAYGLDVESQLGSIFPIEDTDKAEKE